MAPLDSVSDGVFIYISEKSSEIVVPSASASTFIASKLGFAPPVSMRDIYVRAKPQRSANSSHRSPRF